MPYPTVEDDGQSVTLDLHGATVAEAMRLTRCVLEEAALRGRDRVKVIHGSSTSTPGSRNPTIKNKLYDMLDRDVMGTEITSSLKAENYLLLSLPVSSPHDPDRINILDVTR